MGRMTYQIAAGLAVLCLLSSAGADESRAFPLGAAYREECGACHVAYPPRLLSAGSWQTLMASLERHFGTDASVDPAKAGEISRFLAANAGGRDGLDAGGTPRITHTPWFRREHREGHDGLTAALWKSPAVKSAANCEACHRDAARGNYGEGQIRLPGR